MLTITSMSNGTFTGTYCSAVGDAEKEYPVVGRYDTTVMAAAAAVGWTVTWENKYGNARSVTTWSGQFQFDRKINDFIILTTWLLTKETDPANDWASTQVGTDVFQYERPSKEMIESAKLRCQRSHPPNA